MAFGNKAAKKSRAVTFWNERGCARLTDTGWSKYHTVRLATACEPAVVFGFPTDCERVASVVVRTAW
jgi:hypothetical protein